MNKDREQRGDSETGRGDKLGERREKSEAKDEGEERERESKNGK